VGHPEMQRQPSGTREMPQIPDAVDLRGRREVETYGDGTASAKKRVPGAGTSAIPKRWGENTKDLPANPVLLTTRPEANFGAETKTEAEQ
jgi:hypothetical protein